MPDDTPILFADIENFLRERPQGVAPKVIVEKFRLGGVRGHRWRRISKKLLEEQRADIVGERSARRYFHPDNGTPRGAMISPKRDRSAAGRVREIFARAPTEIISTTNLRARLGPQFSDQMVNGTVGGLIASGFLEKVSEGQFKLKAKLPPMTAPPPPTFSTVEVEAMTTPGLEYPPRIDFTEAGEQHEVRFEKRPLVAVLDKLLNGLGAPSFDDLDVDEDTRLLMRLSYVLAVGSTRGTITFTSR